MLGDNEGDVPIVPSLCPHRDSQDTGPPHHHTVHLGSTQAPCIHCTRKKRSLLNRMGRSKDGKGKSHPGEVTVFSVGRFRVTHIGKKQGIQGSQDGQSVNDGQISEKDNKEQPMKTSSNGIIQQQDSEDLKTQDLPKSESDVVGLAKLEVQRESAPKSVDNSRVKGLEDQFHRNSIKKLASKDRRSSAPATGQECGVITNMEETKKRQSPETASDQVQQVNSNLFYILDKRGAEHFFVM
ncbi:hypothetical protein GDO86_020472 [Hymenochirus boettgeri]|uniref:Uncharacterized protein n=1 Tax=Hymenochirus boettgeri TaxID=247094 RepID=A0A8T2IF48_9PIPI|nr:hypothetical protein GDO86_020472 [Hymenochirus boettgeri]